ncbi:hypothetical protein [Streptomyces sp. NRRL WC-3549]|uniref:hypothetical protein n=1 Tax=Streptomyces sp. NRRL WC-3549 TaxID=1463925 RepID=UPI000ACC7F34|nr:hypothetical protein [Streptomyces sp. NRRL WC-3549]
MTDVQPHVNPHPGIPAPVGGVVAPGAAGSPDTARLPGLAMKRRGPVAVWLGLPLVCV